MFDFVRSHSRLMLGLMVLLIFPSFVFFGIQGYSRFMEEAVQGIASVDGQRITLREWDVEHQRQLDRIRAQSPNVDPRLIDSPDLRRGTLDNLVRDRVLFAAANAWSLFPERDRLLHIFESDPQLAALRGPDGKLNRDELARRGLTPEMFDQQLRQQVGLKQVVSPVAGSAFAPQSAASAALGAFFQRREVQVQRFNAGDYAAKVNPSEADLEAYHKQHEARFRAPEQASIEYVVLDLEAMAKAVQVKDEDLKKYYEDNAAKFSSTQERRVSHILINAAADAPAVDREKARQKAQGLLDQLRANPKAFAELAKKHSEDSISAEKGGDLDFSTREGMISKAFADAAFAMKEGEISSKLVESEFGFHILQLTAVRGGDRKSFESVRGEIEAEVRRAQAQKDYAAAAVQFTDTVYEKSDSLDPVASKLKLEKQKATLQRNPAPGASGPLASSKFLDAIFANDAVKNKRNTDAVEVGPNTLISGRVLEHKPSRALPLAEVKDAVRQSVVAEQAATLARKEGEARLAEVNKGAGADLPAAVVLSREQTAGHPKALIDAVLKADPAKLPAVIGVSLDAQGYAVLRVLKVLGADDKAQAPERTQQVARAFAEAETEAYFNALKSRFKAKVNDDGVKSALAAAKAASGAP